MHDDLVLALALADVADGVTMRHFGAADLAVRTKSDSSPVSEADEATERALRELLREKRPDDTIVGEEFGTTGRTPRRWIIDPIDATGNFVRGVPVFATLIALEVDGRVTTGVVSAPALKRRWWASRGDGAFANGTRLRVSPVSSIADAFVAYDAITDFDPLGLSERFLSLLRACGRSRGFGDFWAHMLVAEGVIDLVVEPKVALWDMAPVQIIVEEAGGRFTTLDGRPDPAGGSGVSSNGILHDEALGYLR